jgi:hypothetical protein
LAGVWILARQFIRRESTPSDASAQTDTEADESLVE